MTTCKGPDCTNEANREYCSPACRARAWRERHILRCKHGDPIEIKMEVAGQAVSLEPRTGVPQRRSEREQGEEVVPCEDCVAAVGKRLPHKDCARVLAATLMSLRATL